MAHTTGEVLLVGSVPLDTVAEVFRTCAQTIGNCVPSLPDGEVGDRSVWVIYQAYRVFHEHPQLETLQRPQGTWIPAGLGDIWQFRVKQGVDKMQFEDLKYASAALASYRTFCALRDRGEIPASVRFQVSLPLPWDGCSWFFPDPADFLLVAPAYEAAMTRELDQITAQIPAKDLALQWDVCREVLELEGVFPSSQDPWERYAGQMRRLSPRIPENALLGYHLCYADLGHRHMKEPQDLSLCVRMANAAVAESGRQVDWVHIPVPRNRADDAYFAPLQDLAIGDAKLYVGLIHHTDGVEGALRRLAAARKYASGFGVATECGFGRRAKDTLPELLRIHREVAASL
ncbi:MAG: hypothetical protein ACRERD_13800 [Candidatus Binatia bacterium]